MTARPQRTRRGPGPLIPIVLLFNAAVGLAHDPGLSALEVSVSGTTISATLSVSAADLTLLAPAAVPEEAVTRLRDVARDAVHLTIEGEPLVLEWQHVESDRSGTRVRFVHVRSSRSAGRLVVTSDLPRQLSRGHRELLTVSVDRRVVSAGVLDDETSSLSVDVGEAPRWRARQAWSFATVGLQHILAGYDHLVFLAGLILAAVTVRELLIALTAFTVAHSISLALVVAGGVHAPPSIVEPLIAASIAWLGVENLVGRRGRTRWWLVFGFGLVHGFGFAGALTELGFGSSAGDVALALLSFNLGVELGQLAAAAVMLPVVWIVSARPAWHARLQPVCSMGIVVAGTVWLIERIW